MIQLKNIKKTFRVAKREKGTAAALLSLFHREYREIHALDGISFSVEKGEIAGFIGPNGAGKSTAIKIMSGILTPDSGECTVLGMCPWNNRSKYVSHIGVVFGQRTQLWWDVPVHDSLELLGDIYKVDEKRFRENLGELSEILELGDLLSVPLRQLSLGQRMRCEIAASLLHDPEVLFLDEPTIGLDALSKLAVRRIISDLNRKRHITVILTSHDMDDIEALTDRILLIGKGRLLYDGALGTLRSRYDRLRRLELQYEGTDVSAPLPEPAGTRLISKKDNHAVYEVDTGVIGISAALRLLGETLDIRDMSAGSRPIEEIIASLYREGNL
ncbi:MAG: ATP-binding cassette domain-containing protein [Treponema sp.]|nr:ATP-binding cassette domain-containing protein [Treponema sp.]